MRMYITAESAMLSLQNIVGLIPLALILGEITEDLAVRFGPTVGGLLNATFGNVVELILSIVALTKGLYTVVASSLVGSILSNLLLVLGMLSPTRCQHLSSFASCSSECIIPTTAHHPHHSASFPPCSMSIAFKTCSPLDTSLSHMIFASLLSVVYDSLFEVQFTTVFLKYRVFPTHKQPM